MYRIAVGIAGLVVIVAVGAAGVLLGSQLVDTDSSSAAPASRSTSPQCQDALARRAAAEQRATAPFPAVASDYAAAAARKAHQDGVALAQQQRAEADNDVRRYC